MFDSLEVLQQLMAGLAERLRRVSVAHETGVQFSYPAPTIRGRGASGNTSVLHSEVEGSTPSVSTIYRCLRRSGDYAGLKNQRTQFDSARQHQNVGG